MNRVELMNWLISQGGYESYLELGCRHDKTFNAISVHHKVGVDPVSGGTVRQTSDAFFAKNREKFDIVFIDGLHLREQVLRDVDNSLKHLNPGGVILLHDCLPKAEEQQRREVQRGAWTGDVWKAVVELRRRADCDVAVLAADWGLGVVVPRPNTDPLEYEGRLTWETYTSRREKLLRILDADEMRAFLEDSGRHGKRAGKSFRHFILTRFSLRNSDLDWNRRRLALFEKVYLPCLEAQDIRKFECVLFVDEHFPPSCREKLESLLPDFRYQIATVTAESRLVIGRESIRQLVLERTRDVTHVITSRIDTDDAVATSFVARAQAEFRGQDREVINFCQGFFYQDGRIESVHRKSNMFLSMISSTEDFVDCYADEHPRMETRFPTRNLTGEPAWVHIRHRFACTARQKPLVGGDVAPGRSLGSLFPVQIDAVFKEEPASPTSRAGHS